MKKKKEVCHKFCKYCGEFFETKQRYSIVCEKCKEKNHKKKIERNLFNGNGKGKVF